MLPYDQIFNSHQHCQHRRFDRSSCPDGPSRPTVFHQDNDWPLTPVAVHQRHWELGWEALKHLLYTSDFALSDYYLFRLKTNDSPDEELASKEACRSLKVDCANLLLSIEAKVSMGEDVKFTHRFDIQKSCGTTFKAQFFRNDRKFWCLQYFLYIL